MSKQKQSRQLDGLDGLDGLDELEDFDPVENLVSEQAIASYITDILAAGDLALFNSAIDDVVRARGVAKIAESAGISREGLYKALRKESKPRFETIAAVLDALGFAVRVVPKDALSAHDNSCTRSA
jgi:probable addiction module antidote protein